MCQDLSTAANGREHKDVNALMLGAGLIGAGLARQIVKSWPSAALGGGRHARRVNKIMAIEERSLEKEARWFSLWMLRRCDYGSCGDGPVH